MSSPDSPASKDSRARRESRPADQQLLPPPPLREFRGAWIASVANIDWPSKPGLPPAQQRKELLALLDKAEQLNLNAVILQVRPACDALYASNLEPWSEYLNGKMGSRPEPFYDPLAFAVEQAHQRGLELHAWINPFRARHTSAKSAVAPNHVSRTHPQWVRSYGKLLWLDPGEKAAQEYSIAVILDVVKRYDVDGLHVDDYFYPYQEKTPNGKAINFPDDLTWKAYLANGGKLSRNDWRRKNVDDFIQRLYGRIKSERPWVKFGISPFGIWRPGHPPQITGLDAYEELYADSRKWLNNGWCDYFAPQLYWPIQSAGQSYPVLLHWWSSQNATRRHLWPGSNSSKVGHGWQKEEIMNQIRLARKEPGVTGHIHWHAANLMTNANGLSAALAREIYAHPALVPASPWLDNKPPGHPALRLENGAKSRELSASWTSTSQEPVRLWLLQARINGKWTSEIMPGHQLSRAWPSGGLDSLPDMLSLAAVDRCGNLGAATVVETKAYRRSTAVK
ncbi:MAG: family 10 glycosylhydrolase [Verrucomicrobia bacterium]|nr:family 10 glycosylhydrolase [Verrucomicrobiota bacterium]